MNVKNLLLVTLFCWFHIAHTQSWQWLQTAGNEHEHNLSRAICQDPSGNVIITGYHHPHLKLSVYPQQPQLFSLINQGNKERRFFMAKYAKDGTLKWAALSRGGRAEGTDICSGPQNDLFVCGSAQGKVLFDKGDGHAQPLHAESAGSGFLARYQEDAHLAWIVGLAQGAGHSEAQVVKTKEDIILVAGNIEVAAGSPVAFTDAWGKVHTFTPVKAHPFYEAQIGYLALYNTSGHFVGVRFFGNNRSTFSIQDIETGPDGNLYISAKFSGDWFYKGTQFRTELFQEEGLLLALDKQANILWYRQIKGKISRKTPLTLLKSEDGINLSFASSGSIEIWEEGKCLQMRKSGKAISGILRWDEKGEKIWQHFLSASWGSIAIQSMALGPDQELYAGGYFLGKWFSNNQLLNTSGFHQMPYGQQGAFSWWDVNAFWVQLSEEGELSWQETSKGIHQEMACDVSVGKTGNLVTTGTFERESGTQFGPYQPTAMSGTNIFVAQLKPQLEPQFVDPGEVDSLVTFDEERLLEEEEKITIYGREIEILLWDNNEIDGDTISLFCNDRCVLSHHRLGRQRTRLKLKLEAGQQFQLRFQAENTGTIYPNTAAMTIVDDYYRQTVFLASDLQKTQAVTLDVAEKGGEMDTSFLIEMP